MRNKKSDLIEAVYKDNKNENTLKRQIENIHNDINLILNSIIDENKILKRRIRELEEIIKIKDLQLYNQKIEINKETFKNRETTFTTTDIAKSYSLTANKLNKILSKKEILIKDKNDWILTPKLKRNDYRTEKNYYYNEEKKRKEYRWTKNGKIFIENILEEMGYIKNVS